jgi:hypothetical protein
MVKRKENDDSSSDDDSCPIGVDPNRYAAAKKRRKEEEKKKEKAAAAANTTTAAKKKTQKKRGGKRRKRRLMTMLSTKQCLMMIGRCQPRNQENINKTPKQTVVMLRPPFLPLKRLIMIRILLTTLRMITGPLSPLQ